MTSTIALSVFSSRLNAICVEMGAALQRSAFSPNIKDRLDFSCAIFDLDGQLCAQAAHIPVHLGSMAFAMQDLIHAMAWQPEDILILNNPFMGGTHLPDVTVIAPVFIADKLVGYVANRAHHANIGASSPGSMPIATHIDQEGALISPTLLVREGSWREDVLDALCGGAADVRGRGDFYAQVSSCQLGVKRLQELVTAWGVAEYGLSLAQLNDYGEALALAEWRKIPDGQYRFEDSMEDDGMGQRNIPIKLCLTLADGHISADFSGSSGQVAGNINCPLAVAAAAVYYCFRCLLPAYAPGCAGTFRPIRLTAPSGSLLNALYPAAVAAGNVETSSRIVDVVFGALATALPSRIPAAAQGTMNNLAMGCVAQAGRPRWDYYETLAGGSGGGPEGHGLSARQTHMTNTLNTPVESIESHFPVRINRYQIRRGSGGQGDHCGGDGVIKEFEFLAPAQATLLTERRVLAPWGLGGGKPGAAGQNWLNTQRLPAKTSVDLGVGDRLTILTPGGGGWNLPKQKG